MPQPAIDQRTIQAIHDYSSNMAASAASYRDAMQSVLAEQSMQASTLIAMLQQYIIDREELHQQQTKDLISSFQHRYEYLEAQLTADQMDSFRRYMKEAQAGLDLWQDDECDAAAISLESIKDFMATPESTETPPLASPGEIQ
jgi:hypothetical protein